MNGPPSIPVTVYRTGFRINLDRPSERLKLLLMVYEKYAANETLLDPRLESTITYIWHNYQKYFLFSTLIFFIMSVLICVQAIRSGDGEKASQGLNVIIFILDLLFLAYESILTITEIKMLMKSKENFRGSINKSRIIS